MRPRTQDLRLATLIALAAFCGAFSLSGCGPWGDDDDTTTPTPTPTPVEATPTPGDYTPGPEEVPVSISGTVYAVDRSSGEELTAEEYASRYGAIVVYALQDPADLVHVTGKSTLAGPGFYSLDVPEDSGDIYIVGVADVDRDTIISAMDMLRESVLFPATVAADPVEGVDIVFDFPTPGIGGGDGGGSGPDFTNFIGEVIYTGMNSEETNIAVAAFPSDYGSHIFGMTTRVGNGDYDCRIGIYASLTSLIGYADMDFNGLYEPCDPAGFPESNPYSLTLAGASGVNIVIEGLLLHGLPVPIPYISVSGEVLVDESYMGTSIDLLLSNSNGSVTYGSVSLEEPGGFSFRIPGNLKDLQLTARTDSNGDGFFDPAVDAYGEYGPFNVGSSSMGGITLTLVTPEEADTGFEGTVTYSGEVGENDRLAIAIFASSDTGEGAVKIEYFPAVFPAEYRVTELEDLVEKYGSDEATFYVAAALDRNSNMSGGPDADDITGAYTQNGSTLQGFNVKIGEVLSGIDVVLGNWEETPEE